MHRIQLHKLGKRYNYEWIFRHVELELISNERYVVLGSNGSGKSTFLQVIAGNQLSSEGSIDYTVNDVQVEQDDLFRHISYAAPYLDLFEEFTLRECIEFQAQFKPFRDGLSTQTIIELSGLQKAGEKQLKYFSSGMKQRVRLILAILADSSILFLDEPTSNLDRTAISWYQQLVEQHMQNRLILVASNQLEYEYSFCTKQIHIEEYKLVKAVP